MATGRCTQHSVSHAHFRCTFSLRDVQTSRTHMAQGVCSVNVISLHLALYFHVSSAVLVVPAWSLRQHIPARTVFVELYPAQKRGSSPQSSTRPLLQTVTRRPSTIRTTIASLTSRKPHARTLNCSVFPQCLKPLFRTSRQRKRGKRRACHQCFRADVKEKSMEQY